MKKPPTRSSKLADKAYNSVSQPAEMEKTETNGA